MTTRRDTRTGRRLARLLVTTVGIATMLCAAYAPIASADVVWTSEVFQAPTNLAPDSSGIVRVIAANSGDTPATEFPTISFELPSGVTLNDLAPNDANFWTCAGSPVVTCTNLFGGLIGVPAHTYVGQSLIDGEYSVLNLMVDVAPGATQGSRPFDVTLTGGGGATATQSHTIDVDDEQFGFGPTPGSFEAGAFDAAGNDYTQAGGHPHDATASFDLNTKFVEPDPTSAVTYGRAILSDGNPKDIWVELPAGFVGNPTAGPKCGDLGKVNRYECPPDTQIGVAKLSPPLQSAGRPRVYGVYNVVPAKDAPAQFAFMSPVGVVLVTPTIRSDGDTGVTVSVKNISQADTIFSSSVTLWGKPADSSHDSMRCARPNLFADACVGHDEGNDSAGDPGLYSPHQSSQPVRPFLTNPTECTGQPILTIAHFTSWENPGLYEPDGDPDLTDTDSWASASASAPPITGCDALQFDPSISVQPTSTKPHTPTGLDFELKVPQNDDPNGLATAHLKDTTFDLPEGMTVNAASADGLDACTSQQIGLVAKQPGPIRFTKFEPTCTPGSKLGTVEVETPLLDEPLTGDVYLARQTDNPFDSLLALYIVVRGPGILVKIAGRVDADENTGQLSTTVLENPRVPFDSLKLHLTGGSRAPLTTPATCGAKTASASLTSWAGHAVVASDDFTIDCPGNADGFDPSFSAGTQSLVAGAFSPFVSRVVRGDGKEIGRLSMTLPPGMLASVKKVAVCTNAQLARALDPNTTGRAVQATPSCPASSQVGTTTVGAGSGPTPFFPTIPGTDHTGRIFLTEAHSGTAFPQAGKQQAAYGIAVEVPAVAGPFDLGNVLVRAALYVDPQTAQITAVSDKLPRILRGIVIDARDIRIDIDRPDFAVNPTSCSELRVGAEIRAQDETRADRSSRFEVGDCAALRVAPKVSMTLVGRKQTKLGGNPALRVRLRQPAGRQSNLRNVKAVLPPTLALDARNSSGDWLCSFEAGQQASCPESSRIGTATAYSPLLKRPLTGPVYFVKNVRRDPQTGNLIRTLPTLLMKLRGEVAVNLRATSASRKGLLISTFSGIPDARVSRFDLRLRGGNARGILAVSGGATASLCQATPVTKLSIRGHNGQLANQSVRMKTPCAKKSKKRSKRSKR